ncbi:MAG TPA: sigma-54 dependent transcriptional regulator [Methylomirabilota bacterium]|nr:sigma-54 dependent transcriptional regulator [Methylomirabilota bacterium]
MQTQALTGLNLLIVEDEALLRKRLAAELERLGADVCGVGDRAGAVRMAGEAAYDFALLDVNLPDGSGIDLLKEKTFSPATGVIVMTADGGVSGAVEAMRLGALDYLVKPFEPEELLLVFSRARRVRQSARLEEHRRADGASTGDAFYFGGALAGMEEKLGKILTADARVREHLPPVLIEGETGTGKTTIARWLHHRGPRSKQALVEVNCSALPETLAESELFGHERGAFTDARAARMGLFEAANGGTLFLDELPSLSLPLQAKVLKVIEDHRIRRIGGNREIPVDVRLIAATHCELKRLVAEGGFREDLFHRLDLYRIRIPPLRERGGDVEALAGLLMEQLCRRHRIPPKRVTKAGHERLASYAWPGNVRELSHELERAIVFEDAAELDFAHLAERMEAGANQTLSSGEWLNPAFRFPEEGFSLEDAISRMIQVALRQAGNNVSAAARLLGVSRDYVRYRLAGQKRGDEDGGTVPGEG